MKTNITSVKAKGVLVVEAMMRKRRNMDDRLRRAQREALASQDALLAYEAAAYAKQTGDLAYENAYTFGNVTLVTPNGPLEIKPGFYYYRMSADDMRAELQVSSQERSYGWSAPSPREFHPYLVNGRSIDLRLVYSFPELLYAEPPPRAVTHGRDPLPPARRAAIAQQVRAQITPWASAEGVAHMRLCAQNYMRGQVTSALNSVAIEEDKLARMQKEAGQLFLSYLRFKQPEITPEQLEVLEENDVNLGYQALCGLLASGQLGLEHTTAQVRETLVETPYGKIHLLRMPQGTIRAHTIGTGYKEPWEPLRVPVDLGRKGTSEIYVAFDFELARYGNNQYSRAGQRSEIVFARDKIREVSNMGSNGWNWRSNSKLLVPKIRKQVVSLVEELVTAWASGAQDALRKADEDIYLAKLKQAEINILSQVENINRAQQDAGRAYLFLLSL